MPQFISENDKPYIASITREQFLFHEMRITAKLLCEGLSDEDAIKKIIEDNLFQYPTSNTIKRMAKTCITRLNSMEDNSLIYAVATEPSNVSKQICLYAMMKQFRLIWEFMITVIGEKYRQNDMTFGKIDLNVFFLRLQEQNDTVAGWSDSTITKIKQVIVKTLIENEYIDNIKAGKLNPVLISPILENALRTNGNEIALPAFDCLI